MYQVSKIKRVSGTVNIFKYTVNGKEFFRNELLLVPEYVDRIIPQINKLPISDPRFAEEDQDGLYVPSSDDEDYESE